VQKYTDITTAHELRAFCHRHRDTPSIGFDTEFVSEDTFIPDLCLIQVAAAGELAVIDTKTIDDLNPFWQLLTTAQETVVHAGREEFLFCVRSTGQRPGGMIDLQIAAGFIGLEYPASYGNLIGRVVGKTLGKGETRTDWRRRPLTKPQIEYALQDVVYLQALRDGLLSQIDKLGRSSWLVEEMETAQTALEETLARQRWRRVSGISGLSPRAMAIVRELWRWREAEAQRRNVPVKRVLRDDLLVEMARRQTADVARIKAVRGMNRRDVTPHLKEFAECIERALALKNDELPRSERRDLPPQLTVLGQFLAAALASVCRLQNLAPSLVFTLQDIRDFVAHELGYSQPDDEPPRLAIGWRAEVIGEHIDDFLAGKLAIRIDDPLSDHPLKLEKFGAE
jgi:ribonuclease D